MGVKSVWRRTEWELKRKRVQRGSIRKLLRMHVGVGEGGGGWTSRFSGLYPGKSMVKLERLESGSGDRVGRQGMKSVGVPKT